MTSPFSHDYASLDTLPIELLSRIYSYVVAGANVRLRNIDDDQRLQPYQDFSSIQLISRSFYQTSCFLDECVLRYATLGVSSYNDVLAIQRKFRPQHLHLVRSVCLHTEPRQARNRSPRASGTAKPRNDASSIAVPYWQDISIASLTKLFPHLRSLSLQQEGTHVNTFRHDLSYKLEHLLAISAAASARPTTPHAPTPHLTSSPSDTDSTSSECSSPPLSPKPRILSLPNPNPSSTTTATVSTWILSDFSQTLSTCIKNTAPRYGKKWYYALLADAIARGINLDFELELLFFPGPVVDGFSDEGGSADEWVTIENARVGTRDWQLRFEWDGKVYAFEQRSGSEESWGEWIERKRRPWW